MVLGHPKFQSQPVLEKEIPEKNDLAQLESPRTKWKF